MHILGRVCRIRWTSLMQRWYVSCVCLRTHSDVIPIFIKALVPREGSTLTELHVAGTGSAIWATLTWCLCCSFAVARVSSPTLPEDALFRHLRRTRFFNISVQIWNWRWISDAISLCRPRFRPCTALITWSFHIIGRNIRLWRYALCSYMRLLLIFQLDLDLWLLLLHS